MATPKKSDKKTEAASSKKSAFRIRVCLKAFDHRLLDTSAERLVEVARQSRCQVVGPIPLPTSRKLFCVRRAPHADARSGEHFEVRTHKRIIDILDPTPETLDQLRRLDMPAGVDIMVK